MNTSRRGINKKHISKETAKNNGKRACITFWDACWLFVSQQTRNISSQFAPEMLFSLRNATLSVTNYSPFCGPGVFLSRRQADHQWTDAWLHMSFIVLGKIIVSQAGRPDSDQRCRERLGLYETGLLYVETDSCIGMHNA